MILLPLVLLAAGAPPPPAREPSMRIVPAGRQAADPCDTEADDWQLSPVSLPIFGDDIPDAYDDSTDDPGEKPFPDDGYGLEGDPAEEQCPSMFVIPFDFWDGEFWFDASATEQSV